MDTENKSRADLTLPNPQEPSSVPEIELLEVSPRKSASPQQQQAWLTVLKKELEFLGVSFIISGFLSVMSERKNAVYLDLYDDDDCYVASFVTVAEELLYEELNIYSPIYSELEDKGES
uniref:Membrane-spanning 4-domains, subfamily A, member 2 n=1 Tax=Nannospalax galili TaxID=1026970 RepID=A0A8C6W3T3_NANGA